MQEMLVDDVVNVLLIHIAIPGALGVDDQDGPLITTIQAACTVDANHACTIFPQGLDAFLGISLHLIGTASGAACAAVIALIDAEKNVFLKVGHGPILYGPIGSLAALCIAVKGPLQRPD